MRYFRVALGWIVALLAPTRRDGGRVPELEGLELYQFVVCPYCIGVRRELNRLGVKVALVDIDRDALARQRLLCEGGKVQVPCLRIAGPDNDRWLYESADIIGFLRERVAHGS
ncbi:glutaredoxin family protein [Motiliproteus sediminis]|uniref:glutaredoxin family protein n=1 Tax=Motiliproteus sediminis TaxID=1468178 RepID=UPI001AEFAFDC|nr:glutaredoxin domain-containing protein [Motiliproteus sediminis]